MNLIAAVDKNWAIGNKGQLLVRIPADHRMFREETLDKVVVYGRKTLETFPLAQPLDRRVNIVLSTNPNYKVKNATVVHSIEELLEELKQYPSEDIYIIGGESSYRQMLPYCDKLYLTEVEGGENDADVYFPKLDMRQWTETARESHPADEKNEQPFDFVSYRRKTAEEQ